MFTVLRLALLRHRTAEQDLSVATLRQRLLQIFNKAANDPDFAGATNARAAAESRSEASFFRKLQQRSIVVGPRGLDTRPGKLYVDCCPVPVRGRLAVQIGLEHSSWTK